VNSAAPVAPAVREQPVQVSPSRTRRLAPAVLAGGSVLVAVLLGGLAVGGSASDGAPSGLSHAGPLVELGAPVVTLIARIAALGTVGSLLFAAVLLPARDRALAPQARRALLAASAWALVWGAATALGGLLTVSRLVGLAPLSLPWSSVRVFLGDTGAGQAVVLVVLAAVVLAGGARRCSRLLGSRLLLLGALAALVVPAALTGHSSAADGHLIAVTTLAVHVAAASLWVGGLGALLVYGRRDEGLAAAVTRFSGVALLCLLATAGSGLLAASVVLGGAGAVVAAVGTGYGWLLIGKTLGLAVLAVLGWQHRRRTVPQLRAGRPGAFRRFAVVELLVMLATVALAVALAASPPPAGAAPAGSSASAAPGPSPAVAPGAPAEAAADPMAGHDHGELSVGVLIDGSRFHVAGPVAAGSRVTVHNSTDQDVSITADDGSFDVDVPGSTLLTFLAPDQPGEYPFTSRHSPAFTDVLVVE